MPIHDYRCARCQAESELFVTASSVPVCPHCGSAQLDKLMSAPAAPGRSAAIIAGARRQAAREGHFSEYARSERPRR
jgi:putative FmdB family regulatory protein